MEAVGREKYSRHPFAGKTVRVLNGVHADQLLVIEDWAMNLINVPTGMVNKNGVDMVYGKINGLNALIASQDLALPLFVVPDPEC